MANQTHTHNTSKEEKEELPLARAAELLLDECCMVLPGIQALFGFQLIAVFNPSFSDKLDKPQQLVHLVAISLIAVAIALIMTPAAYHRQNRPGEMSTRFIRLATLLLLCSMVPLCAGICLDFYLVASIVIDGMLAFIAAAVLLAIFLTLWFVLPRIQALRHTASELQSLHVP